MAIRGLDLALVWPDNPITMPTPGFNPDDFPDLTIPERTDKAPELRPLPDMTIPDRTDQVPVPEPYRPLSGPSHSWKVGDRVLAPWEPVFLYTGRIAEIKDNEALIEFGDGDVGWVVLERLRPLAVPRGQKVLSRRKMGPSFFPGEILEVHGEEVCVGFDDGSDDEWTTIAALRIPCQPGPGATPTKSVSHLTYFENIQPGDRVWAPWNSDALYAGAVEEITDNDVHIQFDQGNRGWVRREQLLPLDIPVGLRVGARKNQRGQYFPATIMEVQEDRILVVFDDDHTREEWTTLAHVVLPTQPLGPDVRPTRTISGGGGGKPSNAWLIYFVIVVLGVLLRACNH
jgi:hypothetical protein